MDPSMTFEMVRLTPGLGGDWEFEQMLTWCLPRHLLQLVVD